MMQGYRYLVAIIGWIGLALILGPVAKLWWCCIECVFFVFATIGYAVNDREP